MKINIDISVIIPAFNAADSIGVLVQTLLGETTLSSEIIVVDDGSTDETWTLLSAITDERLILIRQENQGVYAARNTALAIHRGEWVVFLDADDRVAADFLQGCMKGQTKINLDLHASDDLAWLMRRLIRNIVLGLWVMALLISSSIICTTDMKPKLWGIPALGALGYISAFIIVMYVFLKHIFSRK